MTAPYTSAALDFLNGPLGFVVRASLVSRTGVHLTDLHVEGGSLAMDEEWNPYAQARLDVADLDGVTVDPRARQRVRITLGYVYPNGVTDAHQVAELTVVDATRDRRDGGVSITAQSLEYRSQVSVAQMPAANNYSGYAAAISAFAQISSGPPTPPIVNTIPPALTSTTVAPLHQRPGDTAWGHLEALAAAAGARVYADELGTWRAHPIATDTGPPLDGPFLVTGTVERANSLDLFEAPPLAIVTDAVEDTSLREWANAVTLIHEWTDGAGTRQSVTGYATNTSGPYAVGTVGYQGIVVRRDVPATQAEVNQAAGDILVRSLARAVRRTITARAVYWLRPRPDALPLLLGEDYLWERLTRVEFALDGSGTMTLRTRTPVDLG